jgi:hypothetical protein
LDLGLDVEGDGLPGEGLDEDLHSSSQATHQVKSGLLLDVGVGKSAVLVRYRQDQCSPCVGSWPPHDYAMPILGSHRHSNSVA